MKMLVIPDVHLKPWMFKRADELMREGIADNVLQLGDIADDFKCKNNSSLYDETFDTAEAFANKYPDGIWVVGNHDYSYIINEWQSGRAYLALKTARERVSRFFNKLNYESDRPRLYYVYRQDNIIFSHGGITKGFIDMCRHKCHGLTPDKGYDWETPDEVIRYINTECSRNDFWNDISPIWARPMYMAGKDAEKFIYMPDGMIQVAGHTPTVKIMQDCEDGHFISCDVFSTYRDGRPIGTQEYLLIDTVTGEWKGVK